MLQHLEPTVKDVNTPQTQRVQKLCLEDSWKNSSRCLLLSADQTGDTKLSADTLFNINQSAQRVASGTRNH